MILLNLFISILNYIKRQFLRVADFIGIINIIYYTGDKPYKKYNGDAGYDLYVSTTEKIPPNTLKEVPCNTIVTSRRLWFMLLHRSSTFFNKNLQIETSIIDNGYYGEMNVSVYNPNNWEVTIHMGERVSQIIPFKLIKTQLVRGTHIQVGQRGKAGFGSTG